MKVVGAAGTVLLAGTNSATGSTDTTAKLEFRNQDATSGDPPSVTVRKAFLPEGGAVAVHDPGAIPHHARHEHRHCGRPGPIVGWSADDLRPGTHVDLDVEFTRTGVEGPLLVAMTHRGVGDPPYTRNGRPVVDTAFVGNRP